MAPRPRFSMLLCALALVLPAWAGLEDEVGRSEVRVRAAPFVLVEGLDVGAVRLADRLERLGYRRVRERPQQPGEYFWGHDRFWFYRREHRLGGTDYPASLIGVTLDRERGTIERALGINGRTHPLRRDGLLWVEPETLAESLDADRAVRHPVELDALPEHVWRALLAAEDARFFEHGGVDARSLARAALTNLKQGRVAQGGSTITQQLIKNRDLTPKRTLGRKLSEASRALAVEERFTKGEILQAYLNQVYLGHVDGLALHGIGTAARVYFSKEPEALTLAEAATLVGAIQGPNRLNPLRQPEAARVRRDWVLERMRENGWIDAARAERASGKPLRTARGTPRPEPAPHFVRWQAELARAQAPQRLEEGRGLVVETTLDPLLQETAEREVRGHLARLRRAHPRLRDSGLQAALLALDVRNGDVLAYVGADPATGDAFDRVRTARRQPGSTVKPFVLLEAFDDCGAERPLHPATRVLDAALRVTLADGRSWEPENWDGRYRGVVDLRGALADSINVPLVRVARHCGFEAVGGMLQRAGIALPDPPPPSFVLGAVESSPLELARAFTVLATPGVRVEPRPYRRIEKPGGRTVSERAAERRRVVRPASAYLVRRLLQEAVESGTAAAVRLPGREVVAKTGTSSGRRDAWIVGHAGSLVTVVWVGRDDDGPLGMWSAEAAGPLWKAFVEAAVPLRPGQRVDAPGGVVRRWVDPRSGLLVSAGRRGAREEWFRRGVFPQRRRFWRRSVPEAPLR